MCTTPSCEGERAGPMQFVLFSFYLKLMVSGHFYDSLTCICCFATIVFSIEKLGTVVSLQLFSFYYMKMIMEMLISFL